MTKRFNPVLAGVLLASMLAGCSVTAPYQRPDAAMPQQWDMPNAGTGDPMPVRVAATAAVQSDWWTEFGSTELDQLIRQALDANHDLAAAVLRIRQARASAATVNAIRYPTVTAGTGLAQDGARRAGAFASDSSDQLSVGVAYEVDLWGGNAAQIESANARVALSVFDREAVALILQSGVATNYFQALALQDRLLIARKNLEAARGVLKLVETRFSKGATTGLEVAQQRTAVFNIEAQIPQLEQALHSTMTAIAILTGQPPQRFSIQGKSLRELVMPEIAAFQPPELLERRPDIKRAEAALVAANADIGAARAALYPGLRLSAGSIAASILDSGTALATSLGASLAQTIFDGGRLRSQVEVSQARKAELVEQYLQSALISLKEVQDSLDAIALNNSRRMLLGNAAREARESYRIATVRFAAGSQDLLTLLDSQRTQLQAEDSLVQAELARTTSAVGLFKALGGGFAASSLVD
jgi:multidrug efflux system outer membrane protein